MKRSALPLVRGVGAGEAVFQMGQTQGFAEVPVAVAGAIVGEHAANGNSEAGEVGPRHVEELDRRSMLLIGQDGGEAEAGVVVDGDVQVLVVRAARLPGAVAFGAFTITQAPGNYSPTE